MTTPAFPGVERDSPNEKQHRRSIAGVLNRVNAGKFNATGELTLRPSETTTTLTDVRLTPTSYVGLMPLTAAAAAAAPYALEADRGRGEWTFTHDSDAATDRSFRYLIIG